MKVQIGATSTTDDSLEEEVTNMESEINELRSIISELEAQFERSQYDLQKANSNLAVKSSKDNEISDELKKLSSELNNLNDEIEKFEPQAIAGEQTVDSIILQIENNYIPVIEFEKENGRLKELTQTVTENSKEIQLLTKDLYDIRTIEQNYIEKCLANRQCKEAMAERLGVE
jgi:predicted RNase H-like nuclease (RuvC/YqgF family)